MIRATREAVAQSRELLERTRNVLEQQPGWLFRQANRKRPPNEA